MLLRRRLTDGYETFQLILPAEFRNQALKGLHDDVGHPGRDRTLALVRSRFYWPFMATHNEKYVAHTIKCIRRKAPDPPRAPMKSFIAKEPMELVAIAFLSLERGKGGFENILVVTDSFTKFSWALPTQDQKATTVAKLLWEKIFFNYGMPRSLSASVDEALCKNRDKFKDLTPYIIQQTHDPLYNSCFLRKGYLNNKHNATIEIDFVYQTP